MEGFIAAEDFHKLKNEYGILHLLYHRNKNQHRTLKWWKYFNIFHRKIRKIVKPLMDIEDSTDETKILVKRKIVLCEIKRLFGQKIFTKAYFEYNGILALGQFVTLGLALIGNLSKLYCILRNVVGLEGSYEPERAIGHFEVPDDIVDVGEEVDLSKNNDGDGKTFEESQHQDRKRQASQHLEAKDDIKSDSLTIDDIFASGSSKKDKKKKKKKKKTLVDEIFDQG